jgi:hypothetical protein
MRGNRGGRRREERRERGEEEERREEIQNEGCTRRAMKRVTVAKVIHGH